MTTNLQKLKDIEHLLYITKNKIIEWINLDVFKKFLFVKQKSLSSISILNEYLLHLQKDMFIFDCTYSYLSIENNIIWFFAKSKHSFTYRIDYFDLSSVNTKWYNLCIPENILLRIRNVIDISSTENPTNDQMCESLFSDMINYIK